MKRIFGLILIIGLAMSFTQNEGVEKTGSVKAVQGETVGIKFFKGTWKEALAKAKTDKKLIFLDAMAAWCGPCKWMAANGFKDKKVGEFYNKNFINFKMDMEKHQAGPRLSKKYNLMAYPSLYFIDKNENLVHSKVGALKAAELLALGEAALAK